MPTPQADVPGGRGRWVVRRRQSRNPPVEGGDKEMAKKGAKKKAAKKR
jgi:hypothetical protein